MKLSASIDLEPHKAALANTIDAHFGAQIAKQASALPLIHELKTRIAHAIQAGSIEPPPEFVDEAALRGISASQLADLIIQKDEESARALLTLEGKRQALKSQVNAAAAEQTLRMIEGQLQ